MQITNPAPSPSPVFSEGRFQSGRSQQHAVQFYSEDRFLIEELSRYVTHALHSGSVAVVVATKEHRASLVQRLITDGIEIGPTTEQGRFVAMDAESVLSAFMVDGCPSPHRFTDVIGSVIDKAARAADHGAVLPVAIYGEMVALLWAEGKVEAALNLEQLWNDLAGSRSFSLFCGYPINAFSHEGDSELLMKVCSEHSAVIPTESYTGLASEQDRLRAIVQLQQKAQALETEVCEHKQLRQQLERRVHARTAELENKNKQLLEEIQKRKSAEISLRTLTGQLLLIRDEERRRVAHELHESTAQVLATLAINLSLMEESEPERRSRNASLIRHSSRLVDHLLGEVRQLSDLLYPPTLDEMGLTSAIQWYVERFAQRSNIKVRVEVPRDLGRFSPERELAAFRVVQESLTNVQRHSGSSTVVVRVCKGPSRVCIEVSDPGSGIFSDSMTVADGVGISGMRERIRELGGLLSIDSDSEGTTVTANLPL